MASVASQLIEEVTAHAQRDSLEDAREICADGTYFPNNLRTYHIICNMLRWSTGSVLAFSTQVRGFEPHTNKRAISRNPSCRDQPMWQMRKGGYTNTPSYRLYTQRGHLEVDTDPTGSDTPVRPTLHPKRLDHQTPMPHLAPPSAITQRCGP